MDVFAAHRLAIDGVDRLAIARQGALYRQLGKPPPGPPQATRGVIENKLNTGPACSLARARAVEDHIVHRLAAQLRGLRLAKHPAHGIDNIGLSAAIRPNDAHPLARELQHGGVDKRLKPRESNLN
nr:hypothetical protein NCPCFENI_01283 [Cupriavidus sp.]